MNIIKKILREDIKILKLVKILYIDLSNVYTQLFIRSKLKFSLDKKNI